MSTNKYFRRNRPFGQNHQVGSYVDRTYPKMTIPVRLSSLVSTQEGIDPQRLEHVEKSQEHQGPIHLYKGSYGYQIVDGHHRAVAAMKRGEKTIMAHVWLPPGR